MGQKSSISDIIMVGSQLFFLIFKKGDERADEPPDGKQSKQNISKLFLVLYWGSEHWKGFHL